MPTLTMSGFPRWKIPTYNLVVWLISLTTIIVVFVPFLPGMPAGDLDNSWMLGLNQAQSQGLVFGRDIIFTFGPYASVYTKQYHPATYLLMMSSSLYLALVCWLCFCFLIYREKHVWFILLFALLAGTNYSQDALFFALPLMIGLAINKVLFKTPEILVRKKLITAFFSLMFSILGLLPLVKGSLIVLCVLTSLAAAIIFFICRLRLLSILAILVPSVSIIFFWILAGQPPSAFADYLFTIAPIISGYTEAMAVQGEITEVFFYLFAAIIFLAALSLNQRLPVRSKIFLLFCYAIYLFLSLKAGFVRHDGHAVIAGIAIMIASSLGTFSLDKTFVLPVILVAFASWIHIDENNTKTSTGSFVHKLSQTFTDPIVGLNNFFSIPKWPEIVFDRELAKLHKEVPLPKLSGTSDIYPYDQSYLIASKNRWDPRPVFQSYSAYTPMLAEKNIVKLTSNTAADHIFFQIKPIDNRLPPLEDGPSWPWLLSEYTPDTFENGYLLLQRRLHPIAPELLRKFTPQHVRFGQKVQLPQSRHKLVASIEVRPTVLGKLTNVFFKQNPVDITVDLKSGARKNFRLIPRMAKSSFIISPLVETTAEFSLLYLKTEFSDSKVVKSLSVQPRESAVALWSNDFLITFTELGDPPVSESSKFFNFDQIIDLSKEIKTQTVKQCDGSIDGINSINPAPKKVSATSLLNVNGWLAESAKDGRLADVTYLVLTDEFGSRKFFKTHAVIRADVSTYFKNKKLERAGFLVAADVSALSGKYTMQIAKRNLDDLTICSEFKIPVTLNN
jgi:hypothetical protein